MHKTRSTLVTLTLVLGACASSTASDVLSPFPAAPAGEIRHIIELPTLSNEESHKVELMAGKTLDVDCNRHNFGGRWEEKTIAGWGYTYHHLSQVGPRVSTLMACPEQKQRKAFVTVAGEPRLVRYNSKLPLVIYTPADIEVRYRIWSAAEKTTTAPVR